MPTLKILMRMMVMMVVMIITMKDDADDIDDAHGDGYNECRCQLLTYCDAAHKIKPPQHLGGFLPILKGRKTSKIKPEFVIFDPLRGEHKYTFLAFLFFC